MYVWYGVHRSRELVWYGGRRRAALVLAAGSYQVLPRCYSRRFLLIKVDRVMLMDVSS